MHEVIQQVLQAEEEAKRIVDQARAEAERIVATAQRQAQELTASEKQAAEAEALRIVNSTVQEAERDRQQELARVEKDINTQVQVQPDAREKAIASAVRCVCGL